MMYPSHSYESQLPVGQQPPVGMGYAGSFGPAPGSFGQPPGMQQPLTGARTGSMARQDYTWPPTQSQTQPTQNHYVSAQTYSGPGPGGTKAPECEDECAEEECDPDQCGDETRGPRKENCIDTRPLLPMGLAVSTLLGAVCMLVCQLPVLNSLIGGFEFVLGMFIAVFLILYVVTLGCILYCFACDPGQLRRDYAQHYTAMEPLSQGPRAKPPLPKRTQKTWLYRLPVRRYDHYCRWVTNCIGLLNHREFFIMVSGLVVIAVLGTAVDLVALMAVFSRGTWLARACVSFHLFYSVVLMSLAGPILRVHFGLVCRNELASEWKRNDFYVVLGPEGHPVRVNDLDDDEFNRQFESFTYDQERNAFDKGWQDNCWSFWCIPRWPPHQMGEF